MSARILMWALGMSVLLGTVGCTVPPAPTPAPAAGVAGLTTTSAYRAEMETIPGDDTNHYLTAHITNARFVLAPSAYLDGGAERHLVLQEIVEREESMAREPQNGTVTVQAFDALAGSDGAPRWTVRAAGTAGEVFDFHLYKVTQAACCAASERVLFFSLANGQPLFSSTIRPLSVEYAGTREKRYVGFDDGWGSTTPAEIDSHSDIVGVLQYASDDAAIQRVAVRGDRAKDFVASTAAIVIKGKPVDGPDAVLFAYEKESSFSGFAVAIELDSRADDSRATMLVPVINDRLDVTGARLRGVEALRELP